MHYVYYTTLYKNTTTTETNFPGVDSSSAITIGKTRAVVPRVVLTVGVFDEDCYDNCDEKLDASCIQNKCQTIRDIGPTSGIFIKGTIYLIIELAIISCTTCYDIGNVTLHY